MPLFRKQPGQKLGLFSRYAFVPKQVEGQALGANGKLLSDTTIAQLRKKYKNKQYGRYPKTADISYGIIKGKKGLYAIYNKEGQQVILNESRKSQIKWVQNLETGKWLLLKTETAPYVDNVKGPVKNNPKQETITEALHNEHSILTDLNKTNEVEFEPKTKLKKTANAVKTSLLITPEKGDNLKNIEKNKWPTLLWLEVGYQILSALKDLHQKRIIHIDINQGNYLYDIVTNKATAIDFGAARKLDDVDANGHLLESVTSIHRLHPTNINVPGAEQKNQNNYTYNKKTDISTLGVILEQSFTNLGLYNGDAKLVIDQLKDMSTLERSSLTIAMDQMQIIKKEYAHKHPDEVTLIKKLREDAKKTEKTRLEQLGIVQSSRAWELFKIGLKCLFLAAALSAVIYFSMGTAIPMIASLSMTQAISVGTAVLFPPLVLIYNGVQWLINKCTCRTQKNQEKSAQPKEDINLDTEKMSSAQIITAIPGMRQGLVTPKISEPTPTPTQVPQRTFTAAVAQSSSPSPRR